MVSHFTASFTDSMGSVIGLIGLIDRLYTYVPEYKGVTKGCTVEPSFKKTA